MAGLIPASFVVHSELKEVSKAIVKIKIISF